MGVPTSEVGYTSAMSRRIHHEVHKDMWGIGEKKYSNCRSQWPRGLRRGSASARLLRLGVRIPLGAKMSVCLLWVLCCQVEVSATSWSLVQRSLTDCVVCDLETSRMRRSWPALGRSATRKKKLIRLFDKILHVLMSMNYKLLRS